MAALNFPNDPVEGQVAVVGGSRYQFTDGTWIASAGGAAIDAALPPGGLTDQVLTKNSDTDQDAEWKDVPETAEPEVIIIACSDETTAIASAGTKVSFRMPYAMTLTGVRANLRGATTTGLITVDINEGGASVLSTKLTIDATEKTSVTASAPAVISDADLADDAEVTIDLDNIGDGTATGLKVALIGTRP